MSRRIIIGAGSLGREVYEWGCEGPSLSAPVIFLDDNGPQVEQRLGAKVSPVIGFEFEPDDSALIAIADPNMRAHMAGRVSGFVRLTSWRHRTAIDVQRERRDHRQVIMLPYSLISVDADIGSGCILNTHATIGHDVQMGSYCTLSSHVDICGRVKVGDRVFFGSGARVIPDVTIGADAVIGAGAVVVQDVPAGATVFGNPARRVK